MNYFFKGYVYFVILNIALGTFYLIASHSYFPLTQDNIVAFFASTVISWILLYFLIRVTWIIILGISIFWIGMLLLKFLAHFSTQITLIS